MTNVTTVLASERCSLEISTVGLYFWNILTFLFAPFSSPVYLLPAVWPEPGRPLSTRDRPHLQDWQGKVRLFVFFTNFLTLSLAPACFCSSLKCRQIIHHWSWTQIFFILFFLCILHVFSWFPNDENIEKFFLNSFVQTFNVSKQWPYEFCYLFITALFQLKP